MLDIITGNNIINYYQFISIWPHKGWHVACRIQFLHLFTIGNNLKQLLLMASLPSYFIRRAFNLVSAVPSLVQFRLWSIQLTIKFQNVLARDKLVWSVLCR